MGWLPAHIGYCNSRVGRRAHERPAKDSRRASVSSVGRYRGAPGRDPTRSGALVSRPPSPHPSGRTWLWSAMLLSAVLHAAVAAVLWQTARPYSTAPDTRAVIFELVPAGKGQGQAASGEPPRHDSLPPSPAAPANRPTHAAPSRARPPAAPMAAASPAARPAARTAPSSARQAHPGPTRAHRSSQSTTQNRAPSAPGRRQPPATGTPPGAPTITGSAEHAGRPGRSPSTPAGDSAAGARGAERDYLIALQRAIARQQRYPASARRHGQTGVATLAFVIDADGRIGQIRLAQSSGHAALDRSALQALARLGRFEPIPQSLGRRSWSLRIPIRFDLE